MIVEALLIALVFRTFLYQPFSIPTASMQQTLMIGDYFIANKFDLGLRQVLVPDRRCRSTAASSFGSEPKRGDVAVFRNEITNEDYIKRVIGMPGDRIQMKEGRLYINGTMVEREQIGTAQDTDSYDDDRAGHRLHRDAAQRRRPTPSRKSPTTSRSTTPPNMSCRPATTS